MAKILKVDNSFTPCTATTGDKLYPNGIFEFNITKILKYIQRNTDNITIEEVAVKDFCKDISSPALLAEISPGQYNVIDGNHRMEKTRRMGVSRMPAYKLNVKQHVNF